MISNNFLLIIITIVLLLYVALVGYVRQNSTPSENQRLMRLQFGTSIFIFMLLLASLFPLEELLGSSALDFYTIRELNSSVYGFMANLKMKIILFSCSILLFSFILFGPSSELSFNKIAALEYFFLFLLSLFAIIFSITFCEDLLSFYLCIELLSVCTYILIPFERNNLFAIEAGMKYFIPSALFGACFLMGIALIYSVTGTVNLVDLSELISLGAPIVTILSPMLSLRLYIGVALLFVGIFYKLGTAFFHTWPAQVYSGTSIEVSFFFNVLGKIPVLFFFMNILLCVQLDSTYYDTILLTVGALSLIIGTLNALNSIDLRKVFSYSSTAFTGLILIAGVEIGRSGGEFAIFIFFCYFLLLVSSWGSLALMKIYRVYYQISAAPQSDEELYSVSSLKQILKETTADRNTVFKAIFIVILTNYFISASGLPPFVGFEVKAYVTSLLSKFAFTSEITPTVIVPLTIFVVAFIFIGIFTMTLYVSILKKVFTVVSKEERISFFKKVIPIKANITPGLKVSFYHTLLIILLVQIFVVTMALTPDSVVYLIEALQNILRDIFK